MSRQLSELRRARGPLLGVAAFVIVALVLTLMVAGTLSRAQSGDTIEVTAVFRDATGLRAGDDVRLAGVRIGRVTGAELGTGADAGRAVVTMSLAADQALHDDTVFSVDYLNLMGQRYVDVARPSPTPGAGPLVDGAMVPVGRTRPALDLTALFNAFRPVFDLLQPADINELAENIVQVLQGQGPTLRHLLEQTAELTSGIVERDEALAEVVDNVTLVLESTHEHRGEITRLLRGLGSLTEGLADDRDRIATSLDSLARLSGTADGLVRAIAPDLAADVPLARELTSHLAARSGRLLPGAAEAVPAQLQSYLRTLSYGSYLNVYVCTLSISVDGLPGAADLGGRAHSERCR